MASRTTGERGRGRRRASRHQQRGDQPQQHEHRGGGGDEDGGDALVVGELDRQRRQRAADQHGRDHVGPPRPALVARDLVAEQRRDRHVVGAPERPQREGGGDQQPVEQREREVARVQRGRQRQRQHGAEAPGDQERQRGADREAGQRAERRQHHHLGEVDREHAGAGRAERFQGRDHVAPAVEMALDRIGDADAADQQRGQPDQREILGEALDDCCSSEGEALARLRISQPASGSCACAAAVTARAAVSVRVVVGQAQAVVPAHHAARLQQPGRRAAPPR